MQRIRGLAWTPLRRKSSRSGCRRSFNVFGTAMRKSNCTILAPMPCSTHFMRVMLDYNKHGQKRGCKLPLWLRTQSLPAQTVSWIRYVRHTPLHHRLQMCCRLLAAHFRTTHPAMNEILQKARCDERGCKRNVKFQCCGTNCGVCMQAVIRYWALKH
jgi:hypothetical protein